VHVTEQGLDEVRRKKRLEQIRIVVDESLSEELWTSKGFGDLAESALERDATPYDVAGEILESILSRLPTPEAK
jgi:hypothetical protein